jgi:hypothetical protein
MDFSSAKARLNSLGLAGRLILVGDDDWEIELLPERSEELQRQKSQSALDKKISQERVEREEAERLLSIEKGKAILEERRRKEEEEIEKERRFVEANRLASASNPLLYECDLDLFELAMQGSPSSDESIRSILFERYGKDAQVIMQYRHAGSNSEAGNEWGLWIVLKDGCYSAFHESVDRETYGGKSREKPLDSRESAIRYAAWHVERDWYSDDRFATPGVDNRDFPRKAPPNPEEREDARKRFRRWKDVGI